jgi:hypothetical protein
MAEVPFQSDANMNGNRVRNAAASAVGTDYVIRNELDAAIRGLDWKDSVRVASTANINLSAPGATIDGVTMASGESFLAKNQSTGSQNGIYVWNGAASAATRRADADSDAEVTSGLATFVSEGTTNADTSWVLTTDDPIIVGTTALVFARFGGSTIAKFAASIGDGVAITYAVTHNLNTRDVAVEVYDNSTFAKISTETIHTDANNVTVNFNVAPTSNQYRVVVIG